MTRDGETAKENWYNVQILKQLNFYNPKFPFIIEAKTFSHYDQDLGGIITAVIAPWNDFFALIPGVAN